MSCEQHDPLGKPPPTSAHSRLVITPNRAFDSHMLLLHFPQHASDQITCQCSAPLQTIKHVITHLPPLHHRAPQAPDAYWLPHTYDHHITQCSYHTEIAYSYLLLIPIHVQS